MTVGPKTGLLCILPKCLKATNNNYIIFTDIKASVLYYTCLLTQGLIILFHMVAPSGKTSTITTNTSV